MKFAFYSLTSFVIPFLLVSCGGDSNVDIDASAEPTNFSAKKNNEDLIGSFALPEMKKAISGLESIEQQTKNCTKSFDLSSLEQNWKETAQAYQRLKPLEVILLARDPEASSKLAERYLGGVYSADKCGLQKKTAEQKFFNSTLAENPALNSLEFLIFADVSNTNHCTGANKAKTEDWLSSENKVEDLCNHINFISKEASTELSKINSKNEELYKAGKNTQIIPDDNLQTLYDRFAVFIDKDLKDSGVGFPLGLTSQCNFLPGQTCPTAVAHVFANMTFEAVTKNLEGLMAVYNQNTSMSKTPQPKGLYQFLIANNKNQVAIEFYKNLIEAHTLSTSLHGFDLVSLATQLRGIENKEKCINTSLENKEIPACALFKSIKALSDRAKGDLRLALSLSTIDPIEGDSD